MTLPEDRSLVRPGDDFWLPGFGPEERPAQAAGGPGEPQEVDLPSELEERSNAAAEPVIATQAPLSLSTFSRLTGAVTKYLANVEAIGLLRELEASGKSPSESEREVLNRYTGWGGIPKAFNDKQTDAGWAARARELQALLTESEYASAKDSTPNAHYTALPVVQAMWTLVTRLGFRGGRILEPAAGVGYFLGGMPAEIAERSQVTAVELDQLSARILRQLYGPQGVNVIQGAFENAILPDGFFDLAIGNVPFGNYKVAELRNVPYQNFLIHDYFFARALDAVRPGGLVVFITSSGTMDKRESHVRQYLASKATLLTAIRLPCTTFKAIANTEVTTDILVLQKPVAGAPPKDDSWTRIVPIPHDSPLYGEKSYNYYDTWRMQANQYFVICHPQQVIGTLALTDNGYEKSVGCVFEGDLEEALAEQIEFVPEGVYAAATPILSKPTQSRPCENAQEARIGYRVEHGQLLESDGRQLRTVALPPAKAERIKALVGVREAARELIEAQPVTEDDAALQPLRERLNALYDAFRKTFGALHDRKNQSVFRQDSDWPLLLSLECVDAETGVTTKSDLFSRRTVGVTKPLEHAESAMEALLATLAETGTIEVGRIGSLLGRPGEDALQELEGLGAVFKDPASGAWETADAYLSGEVKEKLSQARAAGPLYAGNVVALEAVIPSDLAPHEIGARVGSTWIPASDYEAFLDETFARGSEQSKSTVAFSAVAGAWDVSPSWGAERSVAATQTYGTRRVSALTLFAQALNQQVPTVYDRDPMDRDRQMVNQTETIAAREKQQDLKARFVEWLWADDARAQRLVRLYNDGFNNRVERKYDGAHLVLPGFSQCVELGSHQKNAIWRIVAGGRNALLAHPVGAGKTFVAVCAGMELKRLGKARKPCHIVPNHILEQYTAEFLRAYPGAKVLMATKEDLGGDQRRTMLSRIATGDWDAVIITHSSFERIPMSAAYLERYIAGEIQRIEDAMLQVRAARKDNRIVKELARAKKQWTAKLLKLSRKDKKDNILSFEDLGIDQLFVDESHLHKNLFRMTKMSRVAGLPNSNSERSFDLFVKTRYIMEHRGEDTGIVFATATPIANSMAEMWVVQRYLQPTTLERHRVGAFDTWAGNFGESVTALEVAPDGSGYRMHTRFARFVNLPELMTMFREVADIQTKEVLKLPTPVVERGIVTAKGTEALKAYVEGLVERAERIRAGQVRPSEDNMLAVTNDGRKAALDMRLVSDLAGDAPGSKVALCAANVHRIWEETTESDGVRPARGAQLIFCDLSTPTNDGSFNVYSDLKKKLMALGIPGREIAFIHDYDSDTAKARFFKAIRDGLIRVALGSTGKMGIGTNAQTRLVAAHHLDAPWRPADIEQREGRIERQGNLNAKVHIYRYVTEGSFDTYLWQTLETKARFIAQVMHGDTGIRSAEEIELAALSYAEVKALASGNPLVIDKAGVDAELAKLALLKSKWDQQRWENRQEIASLPAKITWQEEQIAALTADIETREDTKGEKFVLELAGVRHTDRESAGKAFLKRMRTLKPGQEEALGHFAGFALCGRAALFRRDGKELVLQGKFEHTAIAFADADRLLGELEWLVASFENKREERTKQLAQSRQRLADLKVEVERSFAQADRLAWLRVRQREIEVALGLTRGDLTAADEGDISEAA